ncbi:MAG: LPS assembly lipoprotein LptE [Shinella sp.]|nr:LPS assembly lipoprotein LptE [Shinella sp.]
MKRAARLLISVGILTLAGCQVRPLYSTGSGMEQTLASISISEAKDRIEQKVRNSLIFLLGGGSGEPANPQYRMELNVTSTSTGVLIDTVDDDDAARAGRITVSADYNLARTDTGETIRSGKRSVVALADFPIQEFAKVRAIRDAENRAARELAEVIRADIAASLSRR